MNKKINVFTNSSEVSLEVQKELVDKLKNKNYIAEKKFNENAELNIVLGGDGTFLRSVHESNFSNIPFVGINTGSLGYFQEINIHELDDFIDKYEKRKYRKDQLLLLKIKFKMKDGSEITEYCLNEIVIKSKIHSIIHLNIYIDDYYFQELAGDGLVLSTPSGSTAYNMSLGGAILYQDLEAFQMVPIAPIRSKIYKPLVSPLVLTKDTKVKVEIKEKDLNNILLSYDGIMKDFSNINNIEISIPNFSITKLIFKPTWYWENIQDKLL